MESTQAHYTQSQVAELFKVSSSAVRLWRLEGLVEGKRRGNKWFYSPAEIEQLTEWRADQRLEATEDNPSEGVHASTSEESEVKSSGSEHGTELADMGVDAVQDDSTGAPVTSSEGEATEDNAIAAEESEVKSSGLEHGAALAETGADTVQDDSTSAPVTSREGETTQRKATAGSASLDQSMELERVKDRFESFQFEKEHLTDHVATLRTQLEKTEHRYAGELDQLHKIIGDFQTTMKQVERAREAERQRTDTMIERRDHRIAELTQERDSHLEQAKVLVADVDAREQTVEALQAAVSERDGTISNLSSKTEKYERQVDSLSTVNGWIRHRWLYGRRKSASR